MGSVHPNPNGLFIPYLYLSLQHVSFQVNKIKSMDYSDKKQPRTCKSVMVAVKYIFRYVLFRANPFWVQLCYFVSFSFLGFLVLKALKTRTSDPRNLDLFFTSVSAATVSSMSTVEMEVFSNSQLVVLTILMFIGGEVFTSMVGLHFYKLKTEKLLKTDEKVSSVTCDTVELGVITYPPRQTKIGNDHDHQYLKYRSIKFLCYLVQGYLLLVNVVGLTLVSSYLVLISSAKHVLETKGLEPTIFSVFITVSTFANCGFVPTNENMIVFKKNSGLLLILIPQVLLGNTLFPSCLRLCIWVLGKVTKRPEWDYLMNNSGRVGYILLGGVHSRMLAVTVSGFVVVQMVLFCAMDWDSDALSGLSGYEKVVGAMFQSVNARHAGESIVDITVISKAVLVLTVIMMYLPPNTSIVPMKSDRDEEEKHPEIRENSSRKMRGKVVENLIFSQLSYLAIFVMLICITERQQLKQDPLNFNVLNIIVEVISAYGNVGFTTGYSCARQLNPDGKCIDKWYGFSGKWSDEGKLVLIVVMIFGRLKSFNMNGGKAWILT